MKKVVRLTESELTRIVKRVINEKKDMIRITGDYSGVKHVLGISASPKDIIFKQVFGLRFSNIFFIISSKIS